MIEEKPKHSRFAPSKMERRIACPGSAHVDNKDIESSEAAREGDRAHEEAAKILSGNITPKRLLDLEIKHDIKIYLDYILSLSDEYVVNHNRYVEIEVFLDAISDEIYGTSDCIVSNWPNTLHVIDLKYGKGKLVEVDNNAQLATYGLGALERFGTDFDEVWLTIIQPRAEHKDGPIRTWKTTPAELHETWHTKIQKAYQKAIDKPHLFKPGNHCMWCSGARECVEAKKKTNSIERRSRKEEKITADNKKLAQLLNQEQMVLQYFNLAKQEAFSRLLKGEKISGFKLVKSFGRTTWIDETRAKTGFVDDEAFTRKLKTPTQLKKLGYDENEIDALSHRPEKGLILVPDTDKRPAHRSAADDFDDDISEGREMCEECKCCDIEKEINEEFPDCDWNCDDACRAWQERSERLEDNEIKFEPYDDENYGCTCPTCGRMICGWCV